MYKPAQQFSLPGSARMGSSRNESSPLPEVFFIPIAVNSTAHLPSLWSGGQWEGAMSHTVWKFRPCEYEMIVRKVDMSHEPRLAYGRRHGTRRNGHTAPNPHFLT